jgi:hypothetical protein
LEEIPDDSQYTVEKKPDFLKKIKAEKPEDESILQIEIQTSDPKSMIKRMLIYYGFLYHDYGIPVKQYVLYIGKKRGAKMPTSIKHENLDFQFNLVNISDLDHNDFLYSNRPEDVVIAILCDFKEKSAERIIETILMRLKLLSVDDLALGKYLKQLEILSNLRNLQALTIKKLSTMSFIYDLETDIRYKQGFEIGTKLEREKAQLEREKAQLERERLEKEIQVTLERLEKEAQLERERLEKEAQLERERLEKEAQLERERLEKEAQLERERFEKEAKLERERFEKEAQLERERFEKEAKLEREKAQQQKELVVKNLLKTKMFTTEYIASITNMTVKFIESVEAKMILEDENK